MCGESLALSCYTISTLYRVILPCESVDKIPKCDYLIRVPWQYLPLVLFIMLFKVVHTFESLDEILKGDKLNESY